MSPNVRFSAVFGTVLAALCFALWRTTRKVKNSARGSKPPETSAATVEDVSQPVEPPSSISPASQSEETERHTAFDVDQGSPPYSPSDNIGKLAAESQMAAAEYADGVTVPSTGGRESSPVPLADITGTRVADHPEPSGCVTVFPIVVSASDGEHDEIVSDGSPELSNSTTGAGTPGIAAMDRPWEAISPNGAETSASDGTRSDGEAERDEAGETTNINKDQLGALESAPVARRIVEPPAIPILSVTVSTPSVSLIEEELRETSLSPSQQKPVLLADSETGLEDIPERIIANRAKDLKGTLQTSSSVIDEASVLNYDGKPLAAAPVTDFTDPFNTEDDQKTIERSVAHADSMDRKAKVDESQTGPTVEVRSGSPRTKAQLANKRRSPQKYEAPVRTPDALTSPREPRPAAAAMRTRAFTVAVHVHFGRRNRCQVGLLPERPEGFEDNITVKGTRGPEEWSTSQDEWYSDLMPDDLGRILREGAQWEEEGDPSVRWTLAGRDVYVLVGKPESGIFAFVSTTRLLLGEDHLVLCTKGMEETVRRAITEVGCTASVLLDEDQGVPNGWVLFRNVLATTALPHNPEDGIITILRPVHDVEIELRGGIRIERSKWLYGHPPQVRLRGDRDNLDMVIDQQSAICDDNNNYTVPGWDAPGVHRIFCGGATASYELVIPPSQWDSFPAFTYMRTAIPIWPMTICGPIVRTAQQNTVLLVRTGSTYLLGPVPGQIVFAAPASGLRVSAFLGAADFPIVWAVPTSPLQVKKGTSTIQLLHNFSPERLGKGPKARGAVRRWAELIMEASYKRLLLEPDTDNAKKLWAEYKTIARRIKRGFR